MRATGSTSHDSDACVIHGNWVFDNMGLQSGVMVSSRRISRACSRAKYQGKRRRLQALRPVHHNLSWGQALARRRSLLGPRAKRISSFCENVAMLPRGTTCSQLFLQEVVAKVAHCLSRRLCSRGRTHSGRCPTIYHGGSLRGGGVGQCVQGQGVSHHFVRILPVCLGGLNVRILAARNRDRSVTVEAFLFSGIVSSKYC